MARDKGAIAPDRRQSVNEGYPSMILASRRLRTVAAVALAAVVATAAVAGPRPAAAQAPPPVMDEVVLSLSAEQWVQTETARVVVAVEAALGGGSADAVRTEILEALEQVAEAADWRYTRFDRSVDSSGLERWTARVETRLAEDRLGGLADRARSASRPGLSLTVAAVAFEPTRAEIEAARADLRAPIYPQAGAELERLAEAFPQRSFRMARIDFDGGGLPVPMARVHSAEGLQADASAPGPIAVSNKLVVNARVVLAAVAPDAP